MNTRLVCLLFLIFRTMFLLPAADARLTIDRFGPEPECSIKSIDISQNPTSPLPSGTPAYNVVMTNTCLNNCSISEIHATCGSFSSELFIDPNVFKRLSDDDCLVNDGKPLGAGDSVAFQYASTRSSPLSISSVKC